LLIRLPATPYIQDNVYLNVLTLNIAGLDKHSYDISVIDFLKQFEIIGLVETWSNVNGEFNVFVGLLPF